jgi:LmbE family N-acetylglucosaminyl deacetylase
MAETVLVVAPHPDDESIGCGGVICLHRLRGAPVGVAVLTSGEKGLPGLAEDAARSIREAEAEQAGQVLGVDQITFLRLADGEVAAQLEAGTRLFTRLLQSTRPDLIYLPHPQESHLDHRAALPLVRAALASCSDFIRLPRLRAYEVWTPLERWGPREDITPVMARKLRAVRCYPSQLRIVRYDQAVRGLNRYRGIMTGGSRYAEVFPELEPEPKGRSGGSPARFFRKDSADITLSLARESGKGPFPSRDKEP